MQYKCYGCVRKDMHLALLAEVIKLHQIIIKIQKGRLFCGFCISITTITATTCMFAKQLYEHIINILKHLMNIMDFPKENIFK